MDRVEKTETSGIRKYVNFAFYILGYVIAICVAFLILYWKMTDKRFNINMWRLI